MNYKKLIYVLSFFIGGMHAMDSADPSQSIDSRTYLYQKLYDLRKMSMASLINPQIMTEYRNKLRNKAFENGLTISLTPVDSKEPPVLPSKDFETEPVCGACYTPDGQNLVVGLDYNVVVLDAVSLKEKKIFDAKSSAFNLAASPNNTDIAFSDLDAVKICNLETGATLWQLPPGCAYSCEYSTDGKRLLVSGQRSCELWDVTSQKKIWHADAPLEKNMVNGRFDPNHENLIVCSSSTRIALWDWTQRKPLFCAQLAVPVNQIVYNNQGTQIIGAAPLQLIALDAKTLALKAYYDLHGKKTKDNKPIVIPDHHTILAPACLRVVPHTDARTVVVASLNNSHATITGFDMDDEKNAFYFNRKGNSIPYGVLEVSPDGQQIAGAEFVTPTVNRWNISQLHPKPGWGWSCDIQ